MMTKQKWGRAQFLVMSTIITALLLVWANDALKAGPQSVLLEDFEGSEIRIVYPPATNPAYKYLWKHQNVYGESGLGSIDTAQKFSGTSSYKTVISPSPTGVGDLYELFHPIVNNGSGIGNLRQFVQPASAWQRDTFNRLVFWIKVPKGYQAPFDSSFNGIQNMNVGTYVRHSAYDGAGNQEAGGHHFYHFYYVPYTGEWHQVILDTHPSNTRTGVPFPDGAYSNGEVDLWASTRPSWTAYPTLEAGYNYFDALTSFYIAGNVGDRGRLPLANYPLVAHLDGFQVYRESRNLNVTQVYGLNGVYRPSDNYVYVGWNRHKSEGSVLFDVRYSFTDIAQTGWESALPAPNGTGLKSPSVGGYNLMRYEVRNFPMGANRSVFIAIKPSNSSLFNQIELRGSGSGGLRPPDNLRIIR